MPSSQNCSNTANWEVREHNGKFLVVKKMSTGGQKGTSASIHTIESI